MRLIDKLVKPPEEKYSLPPTPKGIPLNLSFGKFISKKGKKVVTFTIDTSFYRILGLDENFNILFSPYEKEISKDIPLEEKLSKVKDFILNSGLNLKEIQLATYIPARYGIVRMYTFPKNLKQSELVRAITLYIQEEISETFADKEVVYSYDILEGRKDEPYKVIATILEKEIIDSYLNWSFNLGKELDVISFEPICITNLAFLKKLPQPFSIIYTDINKIIILNYGASRFSYEIFPYALNLEKGFEETLNMLIWDIRNYIVLNDLSNIYLSGIVLEYKHLTEFFLERLPIFGLVSIDKFPERYALLYTLGARLVNV